MTDFEKRLLSVANQNEKTKNIIDVSHLSTLENLCHRMLEVNKTLNLTAIKDENGVILKHLVDSCACVPYIKENASVCDIGCGGGFPTLVIGALRGDVSVLGVDSVTKKVSYVKDTADFLGLNNVSVSNRRAEELGQDVDYRENFDVLTARAVGRLNLICELCLPLVKVGGCFLAMKSQSTDSELKEAQSAISLLGGSLECVDRYTLKDDCEELERTIVVIRKVSKTPKMYPRNNSQMAKKPL